MITLMLLVLNEWKLFLNRCPRIGAPPKQIRIWKYKKRTEPLVFWMVTEMPLNDCKLSKVTRNMSRKTHFVKMVWSGPFAVLGSYVSGSSKIFDQDFFHFSRAFLLRRSAPQAAPSSGVLWLGWSLIECNGMSIDNHSSTAALSRAVNRLSRSRQA